MKHFNPKKAEQEFDVYNFPFRLICCGPGSLGSDYEIVLNCDSKLWCIGAYLLLNGMMDITFSPHPMDWLGQAYLDRCGFVI